MTRSYALVETPEQEAIARLLCNFKEYIDAGSYLLWDGRRFSVWTVQPNGENIPFSDLILQGLSADGVQAVRALSRMTTKCDSCGEHWPYEDTGLCETCLGIARDEMNNGK